MTDYNSPRHVEGKTALVTGSTSGLGWAIAKTLAREGCKVMVNGLASDDDGNARCDELAKISKAKAGFHAADLSDVSQLRELVHKTETDLGPIEILVNNAVARNFHPVDEMPDQGWRQHFRLICPRPSI
ncbi:MAG: SDR family NAD(P)-dependent oxidoreductase [Pseudolabrys sp.]